MTDQQLLDQFVQDGDQTAFADLVRRHVDWVCSMATRLTSGNRAMAEDVTQAAFILFAKKAGSLRKEGSISNWLFVVTRYCANNALRNERCRRHHEQEAAAMRNEVAVERATQWGELSPVLDELVGKLRNADRQAVLLRFYQQKTFPEIGTSLRISEEAARKRVSRAVEQLRSAFARRGIAVGAAALATVMSTNLTQPASAAAIAGATTATAASASTTSMIKGAAAMLAWASVKPVLIGIVGAAGLAIASVALLQQTAPAQNHATASPTSAPSTAPVADGEVRYGQVLTEEDKPVAGARVWQVRYIGVENLQEVVATALTDSEGRFAFTAVQSGDGKFVDVMIEPATDRALSGGIVYSPVAAAPTELRARAPASVRVRFVDPAGQPAAGLRVKLAGIGESRNGWHSDLVPQLADSNIQTTDAQGACTFSGIPRAGMAWFDVLDDQYAQVGFPQWVTLNSEMLFEAEPIKLELSASISGKLTFADSGKPAAGIQIMATAPRSAGADVTTDDQGRFSMKQLHPGNYTIFAFLSDELSRKVTAGAIENIQLQSGMNVENQDLSLIAGGIVRGKITEAQTGKPLKDVGVFIEGPSRPQSTNTIQEAKTDADGVYFMHVPSGEQHVSASRLPPGVVDSDRAYPQVMVADGQAVDVDFKLISSPAAQLLGRTVDPQGNPLAGVEVRVQRRDEPAGGYVQAVSDTDGHFSIPLVDASSQIRGRRGNWSTLEPVAPGNNEITLVLHPNALSSLRVVVKGPDGAPVSGAAITLTGRNRSGWLDERTTGPDGSYTFKRLSPDLSYGVLVGADGFGTGQANAPIKAGEQTDLPPIVLPVANSFVSGMVLDENGLPVADIRVRAGSGTYFRSANTDITGRFHIDKLMAGQAVSVIAEDDDRKRAGSARNVATGTDNVVITVKSQ